MTSGNQWGHMISIDFISTRGSPVTTPSPIEAALETSRSQRCTGSKPTPPRFQRIGGRIGRMLEIRHVSLSKLRIWDGTILDSQEASLQKFGSMTLKSDACLQLLNPLRTPSHIQLCLATGLAGKTGTVATLSSFCLIWEDPKTKIGRQSDGKTAKTMPRKWNAKTINDKPVWKTWLRHPCVGCRWSMQRQPGPAKRGMSKYTGATDTVGSVIRCNPHIAR